MKKQKSLFHFKDRTDYNSQLKKQTKLVSDFEQQLAKDPDNKIIKKQHWKAYEELCVMLEYYD